MRWIILSAIAVGFFLVTASGAQAAAPASPCWPFGDANGDGWVNSDDVTHVLNTVVALNESRQGNGRDGIRADVNWDGSVTSVDAALIDQYVKGFITTFDACSYQRERRTCNATGDVYTPSPSGMVSITDAYLILEHSAGLRTLTSQQKEQADVWEHAHPAGSNPTINSVDAEKILQYIGTKPDGGNVLKQSFQGTCPRLSVESSPISGVSISGAIVGGASVESVSGSTPYSFQPKSDNAIAPTLTVDLTAPSSYTVSGTVYNLVSWSGCDSVSGKTCRKTIVSDILASSMTVTANYTGVVSNAVLNVQSQPPTGVSITGTQAGTSNNTNYTVSLASIATTLTVPASDPAGYTFQNWTGCDPGATGRSCTANVAAGETQTVVANYTGVVSNAVLNVQSQPPTGVSITGTQAGTSNNTNYTVTLLSSISTNLTAPAADPAGYTWSGWSGSGSGSGTCISGTASKTCSVSVATGSSATVVANYTAQPGGQPDLVTSSLRTDVPTVYQGVGTQLYATAQNIGTADPPLVVTSYTYLRFCVDATVSDCYNLTSSALNSANKYLGEAYVDFSYLPAGGLPSPEFSGYYWSAPATGNHTIVACIDPLTDYNYVAESNENNNCRSMTVNVQAIPGPDLLIASLARTPSGNLNAGDPVTFSATVNNRGSSRANASMLRFCIGVNGSFSESDCYNSATNRLGSDQNIGQVNAGATTAAFSSDAWTAQTGTYRVYVCADATHVIGEFDETNNCATTTVPVGNPDFVVPATGRYSSSGSPPGALTGINPGDNIRFGARVQNIGDVSGNYQQVRFCLDVTDINCLAGSGRIGSDRSSSGSLAAGATSTTVSSTTTWTATAGSHTLVVCADPTNLTVENDENNNCSIPLSFIVGPTYTLTVVVTGAGSGNVVGPGINCPGDCSEVFPSGGPSRLYVATASGGSVFGSWAPVGATGCDSVSGSTCTINTMSANRSVTATFNAGCAAACTLGDRRCVDSTHYQICQDVMGCPDWAPSPPAACAISEFCRQSTGMCEQLPDWHEILPL